jgi:uncharacterized protein (DUF1501 family)
MTHPCGCEYELHKQATDVEEGLASQDRLWSKGFTRRRFIAGSGMVGAAALASQLVTSRATFGASQNGNTLIVLFMRGGADGLRVLVPASASLGLDYLHAVRPNLVPAQSTLVPLGGSGGWAMNAGLAPLAPLWGTGELAFVPAASIVDATRSHFEAQQMLEAGGAANARNGWLDRLLTKLGPGTTFRAIADGSALPASMSGTERKLVIDSLANFTYPEWDSLKQRSINSLLSLYRGVQGPLGEDVPATIGAISTAQRAQQSAGAQNGAVYPKNGLGKALGDLATLLRAEVGLQIATVDVGGWDTHTDEVADLDPNLAGVASALSAFMTDLGPARRKRVTVAVMTEFGRRVMQNASGGTDHGTGSVMWLLGGGLARSQVGGRWEQLSAGALNQGDVPRLNDCFDVMGELVQKRLGAGSLSTVFPNRRVHPLGIATAA